MRPKTIGGMATIRSRESTLERVVDSICGQLDVLYIYCNDHESVPRFLKERPNVVAVLHKDAFGDMNANGKLYGIERESDGIFFTLDDDILYPQDYVAAFLDKMERFDYQVCVAVHGSVIPDTASWYFEREQVYAMKSGLPKAQIINLVGSGTAAFPADIFRKVKPNIHDRIYVDLQISLAALSCGVPLLALEREPDWVVPIKYEGLWEQFRAVITHHTLLLNESTAWRSESMRAVWKSACEQAEARGIKDPASYFNLAASSVGFINGESSATDTDDLLYLKKSLQFAQLWSDS